MEFASREDAGRKLGAFLREHGFHPDVVLGLPRGGVVVASEVAHILNVPLDVLVVRKIGHPLQREYAVGAMAEGGVVLLDERAIGKSHIVRSQLESVISEETSRLHDYEARFHPAHGLALENKTVLLVDDGLATGSTTEAAVLGARKRQAARVWVAAPVASVGGVERLQRVADNVIALMVDPHFDAVGRYYAKFSQTTDQEVLELLKAA